jgi:hypothetical protein
LSTEEEFAKWYGSPKPTTKYPFSVGLMSWDDCFAAWKAGVEAERKRCIDIVETYAVSVGNSHAGELAAEWTMDNLREVRDAIKNN